MLTTLAALHTRALADLLGPLVGQARHHAKNSKELAKELSTTVIEPDEVFNSQDLVSLFTKTLIKETLDIIKQRLEKDLMLHKRTRLSVSDIMELKSS